LRRSVPGRDADGLWFCVNRSTFSTNESSLGIDFIGQDLLSSPADDRFSRPVRSDREAV
jgi:hypothetical protein